MPAPSISVLLPAYNSRRWIAAAVQSVLAQSFRDFELIIIDDGSSDGTETILQDMASRDGRIRLVRRPNTGYVKALNEALAMARGELLARMDGDDICRPDRFALQAVYMAEHPEVVCVGGAFALIDAAGRLLRETHPPQDDASIQKLLLAGHNPLCHPCAMMRRNAVVKLGGYDPALAPAEDLDLWLKLGEVGRLANLFPVVLSYRLHEKSVSETSAVLQRQQMRRACESAWARRGIAGRFEAAEPWRPGPDRASRHHFTVEYGWWAWNSGQRCTAMIYGAKAIGVMPTNVEGWRLLACAALKRPRAIRTATPVA